LGTLLVRRLIRSGDAQGWWGAGPAACASRQRLHRRVAAPWPVRRRLYPS